MGASRYSSSKRTSDGGTAEPRRWDAIVRQYESTVRTYALSLTRDPHQAADLTQEVLFRAHRAPEHPADEVVQETMIKVWRRASLYNASKANLAAWVFSIARNTRIDILRRHAKHQSGISTDDLWLTAEDTEPLAALQQKRIEETIRGSLGSVSSEQSLMLQKMYIEGKSQSEIAAECDIPLGTVKSRVRLAMARLKLILKEQQQ